MKRFLLGLTAVAALAAAAPALAHDHDDDDDWQVQRYDGYGQEYRHIMEGIQHGVSDGSFTPYQARRFYGELQAIRARADWDARHGVDSSGETAWRLRRLHEQMHVIHERGHERMDDGRYSGGSYSGYAGNGDGGGYRYTPYDPYRR
jgi:hypothetical protein